MMDRGELMIIRTRKSVCVGYYMGEYPKAEVPYIVLAGTRKIGQGKDGEDWYDHTYSIPVERILEVQKLDVPLSLEEILKLRKAEKEKDIMERRKAEEGTWEWRLG